MNESIVSEPRKWQWRTGLAPYTRWLVWGTFALAWTVALLTKLPIEMRNSVIQSDELRFSASKLLHMSAYATLVVLTSWLRVGRGWRWALLGLLSVHAMGTEYLQQFVDRTPSWYDVGFDHVGIVVGLACTWKRWWPRLALGAELLAERK